MVIGWWADEQPKKEIYTGMSRGLMLTGGKMLLTMTPLSEAWILDDLVLASRADVVVIDGLTIFDNPDLLAHDRAILEKHLKPEDVEAYLKQILALDPDSLGKFEIPDEDRASLKMEKFLKDVDEDERPTRFLGCFKSLVGLICKEFEEDVNVIDDFKVPTDWPVVAGIDLHLKLKMAIGFYATDKPGNDYVIGEVWENLDPLGVADAIIRFKKLYSLDLNGAFIDPLAKGDSAYVKNRLGEVEDSYTIIERRLASAGIELIAGSKDKNSGIRNIRNGLKGVNKRPTLFILRKCVRHIFEIKRWVYDEDETPKKENDHMMENLYRYTLFGNKYREGWNKVGMEMSAVSKACEG